jgi:hypothetical protein
MRSSGMDLNPFAPPKAEVADVMPGVPAPALWNPNAAANWSLLFSPVFGAFLHMKNWEALGEPAKASASRRWAAAGVVVFVVLALASALLPEKATDGISRAGAIGLLFAWYFASARQQTAFVKARFGKEYPRRGWTKPLLLAVVALLGFVVALGLLGFLIGLALGGN